MATAENDLRILINDLAYIQDELEALKYVISSVPYDERPPGSVSIKDMIGLLKEQQERYYRPLIESATGKLKAADPETITPVNEDFQIDDHVDIQELLNKTIKKRASYVNLLNNLPQEKWSTEFKAGDQIFTVAELIEEHISFDRKQLKRVAEYIMALEKTRASAQ